MKTITKTIAIAVFVMASAQISFAGTFVQDSFGIKYDVGGGRYLENGWAWCDPNGSGMGYCYYFSPNGYILVSTVAPDGRLIDNQGRWTLNGAPMTKIIEKGGYELDTASYLAEPSIPSVPQIPQPGAGMYPGPLSTRILASNNAAVVPFNYGIYYCPDAIEFTEGSTPYIMFNSGVNTRLEFQLTGDNIPDEADFTMDVYVNGVWTERFTQRFVELLDRVVTFAPNSNVEIRIPVINDYFENYVRRVYIVNAVIS